MPELGPSGSVRGRPATDVPTAIRRASLEKDDVQADPTTYFGEGCYGWVRRAKTTPSRCTEVVAAART